MMGVQPMMQGGAVDEAVDEALDGEIICPKN